MATVGCHWYWQFPAPDKGGSQLYYCPDADKETKSRVAVYAVTIRRQVRSLSFSIKRTSCTVLARKCQHHMHRIGWSASHVTLSTP